MRIAERRLHPLARYVILEKMQEYSSEREKKTSVTERGSVYLSSEFPPDHVTKVIQGTLYTIFHRGDARDGHVR